MMKQAKIDDIYVWGYNNNKPISLTIELNATCNWNCIHCYIPKHVNNGLNTDVITKAIYDTRELGGYDLVLTGGEIFLREDLLTIINYARTLGMSVSLLSNASLLEEKTVNELKKLNIRSFSSTIFSIHHGIHDSITMRKGSLEKTLDGIKLLKRFGIPVEIKTPILSINKGEYRMVKQYAEKNKFSFTCSPCVFPMTDGSKDPLKYSLSCEDLLDVIKDIDQLNKVTYGVYNSDEDICRVIRYSLFINSNGDVNPCASFPLKVGNVLEKSIKEIWYDSKYYGIRTLKRNRQNECNSCEISNYCNSCPGIAFLEKHNYLACSDINKNIARARSFASNFYTTH